MKTANLPSLRVDPDLRHAAEDVLLDGESLSSFVEQSVRANIERRRTQQEFVERGLASREQARRSNEYVSSGTVLKGLEKMLAKAKSRAKKPT